MTVTDRIRATATAAAPAPDVLARFQAGNPRGSWPAEHKAQELRDSGQPVDVVMDRTSDDFLVVAVTR